jgi:hypothetical protein
MAGRVPRRLTFLQEAVIERLRARGFIDVADAAHAAWSLAQRLETPEVLRIGGPVLLRDFERANAQAEATT